MASSVLAIRFVRTGSFTSRVITLAFPVAVESAFAFPVAISFLFCNFLHNRQGFSANFGPIILVPIFFCLDFPSFQSFSPLKCAWWDCFRTRVTATLLANRVVRSGCGPLFARSTRTKLVRCLSVLLKPVIRVNASSAGEATRPFREGLLCTTEWWYNTVPET